MRVVWAVGAQGGHCGKGDASEDEEGLRERERERERCHIYCFNKNRIDRHRLELIGLFDLDKRKGSQELVMNTLELFPILVQFFHIIKQTTIPSIFFDKTNIINSKPKPCKESRKKK